MMSRILLVSWSLPPEPTGSAVIVGNLAKQFTANEIVLIGEKPHGRPSISWKNTWPPIHYVTSTLPSGWRGERWWRRLQLPIAFWRSISLLRKTKCAALLVVFPNEEFLLVGYLAAVWTGVPMYAYFHNTYLENREGLSFHFAKWLQTRVFSKARHIFVMSEGMVDLYRKNYPDLKCSALLHSYNEDVPEFTSAPQVHSPLRLVICGNINESCREATVRFFEALSRMDKVSITLLSGTSRKDLEELGVLRNGTQYATVSRDEVVTRLQEADIVVLPHGFTGECADEEYRTMFPTKTIEYLICRRPILAHSPADSYVTSFLKKHKCALVVDKPSVTALINAVERLRQDGALRAELVKRALSTAKMFHAACVAGTLRSRLELNGDGIRH